MGRIKCREFYCLLKYRTPDVKCNDTIHTLVPDVSCLDLQESGPGALDPRWEKGIADHPEKAQESALDLSWVPVLDKEEEVG